MARVVTSDEAKAAIKQIQTIVNGTFTDQITQLNTQGGILSDQQNWAGPLADQFRNSTWPETKAALDKAKTELDDLRGQLDRISQNIMTAGGGG